MVHHGVTLEHDASFSHALFAFAGVQCPLACPKPAGRVPLGTVAGRQHWTFLQMQCLQVLRQVLRSGEVRDSIAKVHLARVAEYNGAVNHSQCSSGM